MFAWAQFAHHAMIILFYPGFGVKTIVLKTSIDPNGNVCFKM